MGGLQGGLGRYGVTEREAEVLSAIADRLRNREIAEHLHVSVRTVESHIAALMRKLGVTGRAALVELGNQVRRDPGSPLPTPLTSLVGRDHEAGELRQLLDAHRLVTLTGPGGVGKTRLALLVADHARFADLAPVGADLVGDTLARALGVVPQPGWVLRDVVGDMQGLLVVDNCEHVIAETAGLVDDLLAAGSGLRVLATSREPLGVPGEVSYQVPTLPVPPADAEAGTYAAVRLFVDRAAAAAPGFTLTADTAPAVAALCRRLDGLPLAIELAASRIRSFEPAELLIHVDERFELLSAGARTAPARQQTLRGAIDWSYQLLDEDERRMFDRLGVFPADFDFDAVRAVCGADAITLLPRLVDKSLVSTVGRGRYRLLETIRAYAVERLAADDDAKAKHASHYLSLAEQAAPKLRTTDQRAWADRLTAEQANLRTAMATCDDVETAWHWVATLQRFWDITGQHVEAQNWIRKAQGLGDPPATPRAVAGLAAASALQHSADAQGSFALAQQAVQLAAGLDNLTRAVAARELGLGAMWVRPELMLPSLEKALELLDDDHPWEQALVMQGIGQAHTELSETVRWGHRSVALFREVGDLSFAANGLYLMAQRAMFAGVTTSEVDEWLTESRQLAETVDSDEDRAHASVAFGQLAWLRGDHEGGAELMDGCLPTLRRLGDRRCAGRALFLLGEWSFEQHDLATAAKQLAGSVEAVAQAGQSVILVRALDALAAVLAAQGHARQAAMVLGTAADARQSAGGPMLHDEPPDEELRTSLLDALGEAAFVTAHSEGSRVGALQVLRLVQVAG
ncbi:MULTISPECIES: LuxR C-terminal-related transcriptional regulator [unclassified Kribbella]|uniref:ATP-binding protein n=1 Tax=unclassified Kribbella TaxID=2644121 RepID=UPI0033E86FF0